MNVQVPNIPFGNQTATFYEDFKEYCKTSEWRIFIQKQVYKEHFFISFSTTCLSYFFKGTTIERTIFVNDNKSVSNKHEKLVE